MIRAGLTMLLLAAGCSAGHDPVAKCDDRWNQGSAQHPRASTYQQALDSNVAGALPGAVLGIRDRDGVWARGRGLGRPRPPGPDAGLPRVSDWLRHQDFAATLMLRLAEQGQLDLDAPIAQSLPAEIAKKILNSDKISTRMLLNHSSGSRTTPTSCST